MLRVAALTLAVVRRPARSQRQANAIILLKTKNSQNKEGMSSRTTRSTIALGMPLHQGVKATLRYRALQL